jgi:riboflavin kinase/FMN adenylyltransferase
MKTIYGLENYPKERPSVVTVGTFDGVHLGHQSIISRLVQSAKKENKTSVLLTFYPHPRMVLQSDVPLKLIQTIEERRDALEETGLDVLVIHPFTESFSRMDAEQYVKEVLVGQLNVHKIVMGYDHRFGRNRNANINDMHDFGDIFDFEIEEISATEVEAIAVSSTKIRKAILKGDMKKAFAYLGRRFKLSGEVIHGEKRGRSLRYPTANIDLKNSHKILPKNGVYLVKSTLDGQEVFGMMNIGEKPTFKSKRISIEVHFFDWTQDLYGKHIGVEVLERVRDEQKFDSADKLQLQLQADEAHCRSIIDK